MAKADDKNFARHLHHSEHLIRKGNYEAALFYCNKALALRAGSKRCLLLRGRCYLSLGQNENALEDAECALALGGKDALVRSSCNCRMKNITIDGRR
ncbi:hypothetical protein LSAT2_009056 [Lamellibrachia satsuma]|nr:hypothetical protein LSAT2_009056 [Lamellibrachia satsuma]